VKTGRIVPGLAVSILCIYFIIFKPRLGPILEGELSLSGGLFGQLRLNFRLLWQLILKVELWPLVVCLLITPLHVFVRSHRWTLLVASVGKLRLFDSFSLQMVGYLANTVLPFRAGEVIRGVLLAGRARTTVLAALATVVVERILDILSLLVLAIVIGLLYPFPELVRRTVMSLSAVAAATLLIAIYLVAAPRPLGALPGRLLRILPERLEKTTRLAVERFASGFGALRSIKSYPVVGLETLVLWLLYALQSFLVIVAFGFHRDYPLIAASPLLASFVILIVNTVGISVPSAPAGIGTFHAICIFGLSLFGVAVDPAAGFALVIHAITILFFLIGGLPFMWREGLQLSELKRLENTRD